MSIAAHWTPDCQGKQDFDGPIITVSTRYWPRGGGFSTFNPAEGWKHNEDRPEIKPSAKCEIILHDVEEDHNQTLAECDFEAETEDEVKQQVEVWANEQRDKLVAVALQALRPAGGPPLGVSDE